MNLIDMAAKLFINKIGSNLDVASVAPALTQLLPTSNGELDIGNLVGMFKSQGLASMASSWLGDGANSGIDASQIMSTLGQSKVSQFASQLGIGEQEAAGGLSDMIPDLIDKTSEGGNLLKAGAGMLGKLF